MPEPPPARSVRPATREDVPALLPMVQAICDWHEALDPRRFDFVPGIAQRYARWLPQRIDDPESVVLVAEAGGPGAAGEPPHPAGFVIAQIMDNVPIYRTARYGWFHDLWVEPAFRRRGIAGALVDAAVARLRAAGVTQLRGETARANDAARALLARRGFRESAVEVLLDLSSG